MVVQDLFWLMFLSQNSYSADVLGQSVKGQEDPQGGRPSTSQQARSRERGRLALIPQHSAGFLLSLPILCLRSSLRWVSHPLLIISGKIPATHPEVHLASLGVSKSSHVDNQD